MTRIPLVDLNGIISRYTNKQEDENQNGPLTSPPVDHDLDEAVIELLTAKIHSSKLRPDDKANLVNYVKTAFPQLPNRDKPGFARNTAYLIKLKEVNEPCKGFSEE